MYEYVKKKGRDGWFDADAARASRAAVLRKTRTPTRAARAEAMYQAITAKNGMLTLGRATYQELARRGLTRSAVDLALDDLCSAGRVRLDGCEGLLVATALEQGGGR
jgi:hypothetical protein